VDADQNAGHGLVCLAVLFTIAILMIAGCTDSPEDRQDPVTAAGEPQHENPAAGTPVPTGTTIAESLPTPDPSTPYISIDPVGEKNLGDLIVISGITNLPEHTMIFLYRADGTSGEETLMANKPVLAGPGGINRWKFALDSSGYSPGTRYYTVSNGKKDVSESVQVTLRGTARGAITPIFYAGAATGTDGAPVITVQPIGDRKQGDVFLISGTTTLPEGTLLMYKVYPDYFEDPSKRSAASTARPSGIAGDTIVTRGDGATNKWSCALDTGGYEKSRYIVNITTISEDNLRTDVFGSAEFAIM
jgi:hypothetical protein